MNGRDPRYYWDSCIYLAHLNPVREAMKHGKPTIAVIKQLMTLNAAGKSSVVGSQIIKIEVLEFGLNQEQKDRFTRFFRFNKNQIWDVDSRVAALAREIRDYYKARPILMKNGNTRGIKTPDAIHLATAILHNVDEFHTLDGGGQDGFSLLDLDGNVAGHSLNICRPRLMLKTQPIAVSVPRGPNTLFYLADCVNDKRAKDRQRSAALLCRWKMRLRNRGRCRRLALKRR